MFQKEEVERILDQARRMDSQFEIHGVSEHQYKLKPKKSINSSFQKIMFSLSQRLAMEGQGHLMACISLEILQGKEKLQKLKGSMRSFGAIWQRSYG